MEKDKEKRRPSVDFKFSWAQKLNPRLMFKRGSDAGIVNDHQSKHLVEPTGKDRPRSNSVDCSGSFFPVGMTDTPPNTSEDELDEEVHRITQKQTFPPEGTIEHLAIPTDTLASIAAHYKSTTSELRKINKMMSPLIFPGQKIYVPSEEGKSPSVSPVPRPQGSPMPRNRNLIVETSGRARSSTFSEIDDMKKKEEKENAKSDKKKKKANAKLILNSTFSADAKYVTGGQKDVSGMLIITASEVRFEPQLTGDPTVDLVNDLVRYRMSLGKNMIAANLMDEKPYSKPPAVRHSVSAQSQESHDLSRIEEDSSSRTTEGRDVADEESQRLLTEISNGPTIEINDENHSDRKQGSVKFLRLKLGIPSAVLKELPTISKLIRKSLPVETSVEHYFELPDYVIPDFDKFMKTWYPALYNQQETLEEIAQRESVVNVHLPPKTLRRTLSVAELCNLPLPDMSEPSTIFTETHIRIFREQLPARADGRPWKLAYSSSKHGFSIGTMYRKTEKVRDSAATLLIIKDTDKQIFGALLTCNLVRSESFYGTGETFLFTFHPTFKTFPWSGKNSYFAKGNTDSFTVGASDGVFGIWLDDDLNHGRNQRCETFDNDLLTVNTDFKISTLEIWQFPFDLSG